uniref:HECT domain-containing protein n=1 Tax=Oreochromis aureus TaxID=47969 RepID=A0AAZ1XDB4_OREAU
MVSGITTPTSSEEFQLAQAGLGKRHLTMSRDMNHEELFGLLQSEYPKMQGLTGGWLLYKATGGQGKRKLTLVPPDSEGYTGTLIRSMTGNGKNLLYIVPLQQEFDLTPLPPDAVEFKNMPKAQCQTCKVSLPLHILALHVQELSYLTCGESVDDVLDAICQRVDVEKQFSILISRTNILERPSAVATPKKNSPTAMLKVSFFGEAGIDTGALLLKRISHRTTTPKSPRYSLTDFDSGLFRTVGEILVVSLAQGGPAPTFFSQWAYSYLCNGQINPTQLDKNTVADSQLRLLIDQQSLQGLTDEILNCGFTGAISVQNKEPIVRAITLHAVLRLQPMLEQLKEGLQLYGLHLLIKQYPEICQPLSSLGRCESEYKRIFSFTCIEKGTSKHQVELDLVNFIQDLLYESEDGPRSITPARFLQWITGQGHVPLLPSEKKDFAVVVKFNHNCEADFGNHSICYPVVSSCAKTIVLPVKHMKSYSQFRMVLLEAFHLGQEFNNV